MPMVEPAADPLGISHLFPIAELRSPRGGPVGMMSCPGKCRSDPLSGASTQDLDADLHIIRDWGATVLITLVTQDELSELRVEELGGSARALGLTWLHLPILDRSIPSLEWERRWALARPGVHAELDREGRVVVHCKAGRGRAGTIAARLLVERGMSADKAIQAVRLVRPGAIDTVAQEDHVRSLAML